MTSDRIALGLAWGAAIISLLLLVLLLSDTLTVDSVKISEKALSYVSFVLFAGLGIYHNALKQ